MNFTFIDTNILIYAHDKGQAGKYKIAQESLQQLWETDTGTLSTQVLQEFYSVATRKLKPAMSHREARDIVAAYGEWCVMNTDTQLLVSASMLCERHSVSWWDALVIEAALRSGATTLLSEDLQDGRQFGTVTIRNPFAGD
ncbi:PIN domain-containing protein [Actinocrispum wychmicini]|uniref:Putative nucleic acid-binding protein n=1 Tax=Actinocrispum wychmicini TaxID=1213861 RepID=A0A4R2JJC5_9PSEU|nr:PIN domain-containing protein [Actinocrispum wychmicini]TCO58582.1 putative nucleic acid-binding protein [Actinocrispum wychmicini]